MNRHIFKQDTTTTFEVHLLLIIVKMKKIIYTLILVVCFSCGKKQNFAKDASSIQLFKKELTDKFGEDAYYTSISLTHTLSGDILGVTQTENPSSLKMGEWSYLMGKWTQNSDITLELSQGSKAKDFMFKLDGSTVKFDLLGKLVEQSKEKVIKEKKVKEVVVKSIFINAPDHGDFNKMEYYITVAPKEGGTSFDFWYTINGTLRKFNS